MLTRAARARRGIEAEVASATPNLPAVVRVDLIRETPTLSGLSLELRHEVLGYIINAGGLAAGHHLGATCRGMHDAWECSPLWPRAAKLNAWKRVPKGGWTAGERGLILVPTRPT